MANQGSFRQEVQTFSFIKKAEQKKRYKDGKEI